MSIEKLDQVTKITRENIPYTLLATHVIQNILDPIAGFIWVYLSSLPADWKVIKQNIKLKYSLGDDKIKDIFSYLKRCGLIEYKRERSADGKLGEVIIHVLCGTRFNKKEPYIKTTGVKTTPVDKTTGVKATRVENHSSGFRGLQKKHNTNAFKKTKKTKSFLDKKTQNEKRHSFADSMDQMATEAKHIRLHEQQKRSPMPDELKRITRFLKVTR